MLQIFRQISGVFSRSNLQNTRNLFFGAWKSGSIWYFLAILAILPIWLSPTVSMNGFVQDTLYVLDISESMNVKDVELDSQPSTRLSLAKRAVIESMSSLPCGSRISIALFAGDESVVLFEPLEVCRHYSSIEQVVARLDSRMRWVGDSWIVRSLVMSIKEAKNRNLNVVMLTDGDEMPHHSSPRLNELMDMQGKVKGLLLGVGGETPQPIPRLDDNGDVINFWTPEEAVLEGNHPNLLAYVKSLKPGERADSGSLDEVQEHLSAFNKGFLKVVAEAVQFKFKHLESPIDAVSAASDSSFQKRSISQQDARWIFGLLGSFFLVLGWFWHRIVR